ncbi:MAG: DUF1501 domain-containing protein [Pseudomonadota bacterium]
MTQNSPHPTRPFLPSCAQPSVLNPGRRCFLQALGAGAALSLPSLALPGFVRAAGAAPGRGKTLILIELAGGNDGLNTIVPICDPAYRGLRPQIGIAARDALGLNDDTALHPALRPLMALWEAGEMRLIEGVGYPDPNRSHFRSIEIWNAGGGAAHFDREGWVPRAFAGRPNLGLEAEGLILGGPAGPLDGPGRFAALRAEEAYFEALDTLADAQNAPATGQSPLDHVLGTYESAQLMGERLRQRLERTAARRFEFPGGVLGEQLSVAARLLAAGAEVPVMKVIQPGYDTHQGQPDRHAELLGELGASIAAFADSLRGEGRWQDVTLVTYSEFGRTARENASAGTDHGTAAPVLVAGGNVVGGFDGARPDLSALYEDDLVHTTDYRALYRAILADLWAIDFAPDPGWRQSDLRLLRPA